MLIRVVRRMWEAVGDDYVHDTTLAIANINPHWCEKHPDEGRRLNEGGSPVHQPLRPARILGWRAIEHTASQEDG